MWSYSCRRFFWVPFTCRWRSRHRTRRNRTRSAIWSWATGDGPLGRPKSWKREKRSKVEWRMSRRCTATLQDWILSDSPRRPWTWMRPRPVTFPPKISSSFYCKLVSGYWSLLIQKHECYKLISEVKSCSWKRKLSFPIEQITYQFCLILLYNESLTYYSVKRI